MSNYKYIQQIQFLGIIDNQLKFKVKFLNHWFDYFQGTGHIKKYKELEDKDKIKFTITSDMIKNITDSYSLKMINKIYDINRSMCVLRLITIFDELDFLHCLKMDSEAGSYSFSEFCDNCGYSNDSINALNIYRACEDTSTKTKGFEWPLELENY